MVVGVLTIRLRIDGADSLKGKRRVVKSIITRLKNSFNVAAAEVDDLDIYRSAVIGVVLVGNDRSYINSKLDKALNFVEDLHLAEVAGQEMEILSLGGPHFGSNLDTEGDGA